MKRLNYANVMASIAVFIALGGGAYAATKINGKDIRNNSVTSAKVKNGTLTDKDTRLDARTRYVLLDEEGDIVEQSGGFKVISTPGTNDQPETNPNIYIDAGSSLKGHGLSATIAIQNTNDADNDGTTEPNFGGETSVGRCNTEAINCVPEGTNEDDTLVVRASVPAENPVTGSPTPARAYVLVTP